MMPVSQSNKNTDANELVFERGGADFCDALVHDVETLDVLNTLFQPHGLQIVAVDGAFSSARTVNITVFLQTQAGKLPEKRVVESVLANKNLHSRDYILIEARLIDKEHDLLCLALTFQGDEEIRLARQTVPPLVALEQLMRQKVTNASRLLSKVRMMATDVVKAMSLFSQNKSSDATSADDNQSDDANVSPKKGPGR